MKEALLYSGAALYAVNYSVGWLLFFGVIKMKKSQHQLLFGLILANLLALIPFSAGSGGTLALLLTSTAMMAILPFGKKGGAYHKAVSTAGLIAYLLMLLFE